jgi:Entner-Doudoroff aldolase
MTTTRSDDWFDAHFAGTRVMAILRGYGPEGSLELATRAWELGITMLEIPLQGDDDHAALAAVAAAARARGLVVGAGTVIDPAQVALARAAGASYLVSPGFDADVVRAGIDAGLAVLPGVATATDIQACLRAGVRWMKAFPARELGADWIAAMRAPFPMVRFVATGGMTPDNAGEFLAAGACVVALGSAIADPARLDEVAALAAR